MVLLNFVVFFVVVVICFIGFVVGDENIMCFVVMFGGDYGVYLVCIV